MATRPNHEQRVARPLGLMWRERNGVTRPEGRFAPYAALGAAGESIAGQ